MEFEWKMYLISKMIEILVGARLKVVLRLNSKKLFIFKNKSHENKKKQICSHPNVGLHTYMQHLCSTNSGFG